MTSDALTLPLPAVVWPADEPVWLGMLADHGHLLAGTRLAPPPPPGMWRPAPQLPARRMLQLTAEREP